MVAPRRAQSTVGFVDEYCANYQDLFVEVRAFEAFKHLHLGMISEAKRKSLPAIAKVTGLPNAQSLQQFLVKSPWQASDLRERRLELIRAVLGERFGELANSFTVDSYFLTNVAISYQWEN